MQQTAYARHDYARLQGSIPTLSSQSRAISKRVTFRITTLAPQSYILPSRPPVAWDEHLQRPIGPVCIDTRPSRF